MRWNNFQGGIQSKLWIWNLPQFRFHLHLLSSYLRTWADDVSENWMKTKTLKSSFGSLSTMKYMEKTWCESWNPKIVSLSSINDFLLFSNNVDDSQNVNWRLNWRYLPAMERILNVISFCLWWFRLYKIRFPSSSFWMTWKCENSPLIFTWFSLTCSCHWICDFPFLYLSENVGNWETDERNWKNLHNLIPFNFTHVDIFCFHSKFLLKFFLHSKFSLPFFSPFSKELWSGWMECDEKLVVIFECLECTKFLKKKIFSNLSMLNFKLF